MNETLNFTTAKNFGELVGLSQQAVTALIRRGKLRWTRPGTEYLIPASEVERLKALQFRETNVNGRRYPVLPQ
jgi:excisionase family DNA binding protein